MIGTYITVSKALLNAILIGQTDIDDIAPEADHSLCIGESWQALHVLLCGSLDHGTPPLGYIVPLVRDHAIECDPYDHACYLGANQVKTAQQCARTLNEETVRGMFNFSDLLEQHVSTVSAEDEPEAVFQRLYGDIEQIRNFYEKAAEADAAVIFFLD